VKILLIESTEKILKPNYKEETIVHVRNSVIISNYLNADLITHESQIESALKDKYDVIICAYGSPYQMYDKYVAILEANPQAKMFWLVNDHDVEDNIVLRKWLLNNHKPYHMICNNPREGYRGWILRKAMNGKTLNDWIDEWHTVNLNALIFEEDDFYKSMGCHKEGLIYYGTYRKWRIDEMLEYNGVDYVLSSTKKNQSKFQSAGIKATFIDKILWADAPEDMFDYFGLRLRDYKFSLYLEDKHTHENYAFMANRFYECVMNNVLMFYDARCNLAIEKSGYEIDDYQIVSSADELSQKMLELNNSNLKYDELLAVQQNNVNKIIADRNTALNQIMEAVCN
jgi:hypothetical protein